MKKNDKIQFAAMKEGVPAPAKLEILLLRLVAAIKEVKVTNDEVEFKDDFVMMHEEVRYHLVTVIDQLLEKVESVGGLQGDKGDPQFSLVHVLGTLYDLQDFVDVNCSEFDWIKSCLATLADVAQEVRDHDEAK